MCLRNQSVYFKFFIKAIIKSIITYKNILDELINPIDLESWFGSRIDVGLNFEGVDSDLHRATSCFVLWYLSRVCWPFISSCWELLFCYFFIFSTALARNFHCQMAKWWMTWRKKCSLLNWICYLLLYIFLSLVAEGEATVIFQSRLICQPSGDRFLLRSPPEYFGYYSLELHSATDITRPLMFQCQLSKELVWLPGRWKWNNLISI